MRILIFNELYTPYKKGGAEISTQLLAEGLSKLGHEIHVCTSSDTDSDEVINNINIHRRKQHNVYWSFNHDDASFSRKIIWHLVEMYNLFEYSIIKAVIDSVQPKVIHTNVFTGFSVIVWKIAKQQNIPIVHTLRDFYLMCIRSTFFNKGRNCDKQCFLCKYFSIQKKYMSQNVDAVVGISNFILKKHLSHSYFKKAQVKRVIPNAVSISALPYGIKREKIIGYLGRIHESKGIEYLIENFLKLGDTGYVLQIGGDGDKKYVEKLKIKYASKKNICFLGKVCPERFLKDIQLLVVPSLWEEPFGRVVVEAQAHGCPVFVSNRGGMPELIDETNGRVFDLNIKDSLFYLLDQFVSGKLFFDIKPSKSLTKSLRLYSSESIAEQYVDVYNKVLYLYGKWDFM